MYMNTIISLIVLSRSNNKIISTRSLRLLYIILIAVYMRIFIIIFN
jgi:hypothetical protein